MIEKLLTPEEAAERLAIKPRTVRDWLRKGKLPASRSGKLWRIREADLDEYIRNINPKNNEQAD